MRVFPGIHEVGTLVGKLLGNDFENMTRAELKDWLIRLAAYYDASIVALMELRVAKALGNANSVVDILSNRVEPLLDEVLEGAEK